MARLSDTTLEQLRGLDIKDVADRLGVELPRGNGNAHVVDTDLQRQYEKYHTI